VEGREILTGQCRAGRVDVVVGDGFIGNAILKFYESAGRRFAGMFKQAFPDVVGRPEETQLLKFLDYSEYGGAPLLGIQGVAVICHGASPARAIMNAVRVATQMVRTRVSQDIGAEFAGGGAVA
jgi:glycerol-3-phosphate acyltransferase PlsX